jgi:hypothetical protein
MKPEPEEIDEARLQALFDRTAELPEGALLTKLTARAADVPLHNRRRSFWLSPRFALPASALLVGALAVLVVPGLSDRVEPPVTAPIARAGEVPTAAAPAESSTALALPGEDDESAGDELAGIELGDDEGELSLDAMHGPASDDEIDDWLLATAALVDEGG